MRLRSDAHELKAQHSLRLLPPADVSELKRAAWHAGGHGFEFLEPHLEPQDQVTRTRYLCHQVAQRGVETMIVTRTPTDLLPVATYVASCSRTALYAILSLDADALLGTRELETVTTACQV